MPFLLSILLSAMEFWGIEVKAGETVKCEPGDEKYLHLSQASLGEGKKEKGNDNIPIFLKVDNKQLVIGTLAVDKCPQITYDLVFEKEFELSHNWKNGSVFFVGYKTEIPDEGPDEFMEDTDSESEDIPVIDANGKPKSKDELAKIKASAPKPEPPAAKPSVKTEELKKGNKEEKQDESDNDEDESDDFESDDEDMLGGGDSSSDEDDDESSEEEDEATPKNEAGKKRTADAALKTPADKKAKLGKTGGVDGKKGGGHVATPHPAKQAGKTPATNDKSKQQTTPKSSAGSVSCKSCPKTFKDDNALQAHTKAKHAGK